jgi:DNA-binding response OmpR family regulator
MASTVPSPFLPVALIVDSDADSAEMYAVALSLEGFTTVEAHDAGRVLHWVLQDPPTVVVTELNLPGPIDGLGFIRRLRTHEVGRDIPVIVVSADASVHAREAATREGCDVFLAKPCLPEELASHVHALVWQKSAYAQGVDVNNGPT